MEERILTKLDELDKKLDRIKEELKTELKDELKTELKTELKDELRIVIREEVRSEVSDQMFVFEEEYGRKINIIYEELTCKIQKERNLQDDMAIMEKRVDKNSNFIFSHENLIKSHEKRITTLEREKEKV